MVTLVTGKVNSGKTTFLLHHYQKHLEGDGFISLKIMEGQKVVRYSILRLSTMEEKSWMIHSDFYRNDFIHEGLIGPYHFNLDQLAAIETSIEKMIQDKVNPIYLDEIGRLELSGSGYDRILRNLLATSLDIILAVREDLVPVIIEHYQIKSYSIVPVKQ